MSASHKSGHTEGTVHPPKPPDNGATGLPGLRTWPSLYVFVLACFFLWMLSLYAIGLVFR